ncbi:MAG: LacI family transcriptional regulator [Chloroflexi bacterium]|nr:LacI family transcriptional regulator [Chloroflexota bacterium]MCL5026007.1 LacI family transcriptional regulator [Chloroflexota bacterium]
MARVTMRDVAARAGVSTATVSLVLSKSRFVSEQLTRRVMDAVDELGYRPNDVARSLRRQSTETVGVLIPTILSPFYPAVLKEIDDVLSANGLSMLFANTKEEVESERALISLMQEKRVDGLLISPYASVNTPLLERLVSEGTPVVTFHRGIAAGRLDCVTWDDYGGSYEAVRHLVQLGRRRIAILTSLPLSGVSASPDAPWDPDQPDVSANLPRLLGYEAALRDAGVALDPALYLVGGTSERRMAASRGKEAVLRAMRRGSPPDAVFATNSSMAIGVLEGAAEVGIRIPEDLAVVGYDENPWTARLSPPLSVVARDGALLGSEAARLLFRRLKERRSGPPETIALPTRLIVRASSAGPSAGRTRSAASG